MTREKAKEIISYHKILVDRDKSGLLDKQLEYQAIDMAIKALEQESITKNDLAVDCISRQCVLDKIQRLVNAEQNNIDENGDYMNYARERVNAYEAVQFFVENDCLCPSVTPQEPRWIPVSERLPEENGKYLVKYRRRDGKINVSIDYFLKSNDDSEFWGYDVIGWLPIPEYKENKE